MSTLAALAPEIEVYSIDEAFLDMSSFSRFDLPDYARQRRKTVRLHTGIPVCVGMAPTKTLAKIANRLAKKNPHYQGVCVLRSTAEIQAALKHTKVEDIWGIGQQWSKVLQGKSCLPMELVRPAKQSICTSRSFGRSVTKQEELQQAVATFAGK